MAFTNSNIVATRWPAAKGQVATIGKSRNGKDIYHLINFTDANTMVWRDPKGTQAEPNLIDAPEVSVNVSGTVSKVWFASPDVNRGVAQNLQFVQTKQMLTYLPSNFKYWDMIVVEY